MKESTLVFPRSAASTAILMGPSCLLWAALFGWALSGPLPSAFAQIVPDPGDNLKFYEELLEANPNEVSVRMKLGEAYLQAGKFRKALRQYKTVAEAAPKDPTVWVQIGNCYLNMGDDRSAIDSLERALLIDDKLGHAYCNLGYAQLRLRSNENAIFSLEKAVQLMPDQFLPRFHLAEALYRTGDSTGAVRELRTCLELAPDFLQASLLLASILDRQSSYQDALAVYEAARDRHPTEASVYLKIARLQQSQLRNAQAALASYKAYLMWDGDPTAQVKSSIRDLLRDAYFAAIKAEADGDLLTARALLLAVIDMDPRYPNAAQAIGRVRMKLGH